MFNLLRAFFTRNLLYEVDHLSQDARVFMVLKGYSHIHPARDRAVRLVGVPVWWSSVQRAAPYLHYIDEDTYLDVRDFKKAFIRVWKRRWLWKLLGQKDSQ